MTNYQTIKVIHQNAGLFIILNRPEVHNALNDVMISELTEVIKNGHKDPVNRYLCLSGMGRSFCAGADLRGMQKMAANTFQENIEDARKLADLFDVVYRTPLPVIIHAKGSVFGGGVGLVAVGDIVLAEVETVFCLSEVKLGLIPAVISPYLIRVMGERQAKRYALTGEKFTAITASQLGLVHQVGGNEAIVKMLEELQATLVQGGPMAQHQIKNLFTHLSGQPLGPETHELTAQAIANVRASKEAKEGVQAFLEKRSPIWGANQ